MQLATNTEHNLKLNSTELRALLASVRSSLAVTNFGTEQQRDTWKRIDRLVTAGPTNHAPVEYDTDRTDRCVECGSSRIAHENHREQLFCWPCADGQEWPKHPRANRAT